MPDLPSSPRKAVSSTSAAARSQTQKKPGAPKPKGAVRAKSGCYTCRIRRKKCDEQPNAEGACQTCVRLRLQCLGFGAKRPDWMRENNSVTELREKIKTFLASQGMIKGHSGSGPRSTDGDPPVLVLVENLHNHPSSPATPTLSQSSNDYRPQGPIPTAIRDGPHYAHPIPPPHDQHYPSPAPPSWHSHVPELNHHDPSRGSQLPTVPDMMYPNSTPLLPPSNSLLSINTSPSWPSNGTHYTQFPLTSNISTANQPCQSQQFQHNLQPALRSAFSSHYHPPLEPCSDEDTDSNSPPDYPVPFTIGGSELMRTQAMTIPPNELINHYLNNVFPIQYLMADKSVCQHMLDLINTSESARDAACMLAATHMVYMHEAHQSMVPVQFQRLQASLHLSPNKHSYTEGDAMAGLHVVSSYLFTGGRGSWPLYLDIASRFVQKTLDDPQRYGPEDVLKTCSEKTRFIIKTTFWFDVLASVTTQKIPRFLRYYRLIFDPRQGFIEGDHEANEKLSMLPVMGCENHIVLAIAEISNLADWKEGQLRQKSLSYPELVKRGIKIEEDFLEPSYTRSNYPFVNGVAAASSSSSAPATNGYSLHDPGPSMTQGGIRAQQQQPMNSDLEIEQRRRLTNDIFRAAARVYLHTVLSGDYPNCPEIREHVQTTIAHLQGIERFSHNVQRGVVRSVVFAICLCGCLTDDARQKGILLNLLRSQRKESVGNLSEVEKLIHNVWEARARDPSRPVNWREVMKQNQQDEATSLLLLV